MDAFLDDPTLLRSIKTALILGDTDTHALVVELFRFLRLAARNRTAELAPPPAVEAAWCELLLLPTLYFRLCVKASEGVNSDDGGGPRRGEDLLVPHVPGSCTPLDSAWRARYATTRALYRAEYLATPPEAWWPSTFATGGGGGGVGGGAASAAASTSPSQLAGAKRPAAALDEEAGASGGRGGKSGTKRTAPDSLHSEGDPAGGAVAPAEQPPPNARDPSQFFTLRILQPDGTAIFLRVTGHVAVVKLLQRVAQLWGYQYPVAAYRLTHGAEVLRHEDRLIDYGIISDATLNLSLEQLGC